MLTLPTIKIPKNPNPQRISDEMWRFRTYCLDIESGTQDADGGIFASKPGYHNYRSALPSTDYSVKLPPDKEGPSDKASAFDWTFYTAQSGNYSRILFYMDRVEAAFNRKDPRLYGFREVLGQADPDSNAEGFDFYHWTRRTPDDSHLWHIHFSKLRKYINDRRSYDAMLSVLTGQSLGEWEDEDMALSDDDVKRIWNYKWESSGLNMPPTTAMDWVKNALSAYRESQAVRSDLAALSTAVAGGAQVIIDGVLAGLPEGVALTKDDVKECLTEWFANATQANPTE